MDIKMVLNALDAVMRQSNRKLTAEAVKDAYSKGDMPEECKEFFKSFVDLGCALFEEKDSRKAKAECLKLLGLINKYDRQ